MKGEMKQSGPGQIQPYKPEDSVSYRPLAGMHPNWKDDDKVKNFQISLCNFYLDDYLSDEKDLMTIYDLDYFMFIDKDFVGIGRVDCDSIDVVPYSSQKQFNGLLEGLLVNHNEIRVFFPNSRHTRELEDVMLAARNHMNFYFDGTLLRSEPDKYLNIH